MFSFTADNLSYNDVMVACLKNHFIRKNCLVSNGELFHCQCACHITNLVVQAGLKLVDDVVVKIRSIVKHFIFATQSRKRRSFIISRKQVLVYQ